MKSKHYIKVRNSLLPLVYKYPYNHHKPMTSAFIKVIIGVLSKIKDKQ